MTQIIKMNIIIFLIAFNLFSCNKDKTPINPLESKQQVFINAKIYTVNSNQPWAEAMLIENGKIIAIGTNAEVKNKAKKNSEVIDLQNRMVMPGIHDVHMHPLEAASDNFQFVLNETETNPENYAPAIRRAVKRNQNAAWILGWGFDIFTLFDATREPIEILDAISTTKPIAIMEQTSHSMWVNSKALELAGIDRNSPNPQGGIIMKDSNGNPNGLLIDNSGNLIVDLAIASIPNSEQNDYEGLINYSLPLLSKNGITSICDARTYWKRNHHLTWKRVEDNGKLTVRVNLGLWLYPDEDDDTQINTLKSLYSNDPNSLLKINQIKLYADGIIINTTAAMQDNYLLDFFELPTNNGLNYVSQDRMAKYIAALEPIGFDFHIHTIGNRGVNEALNAIAQSGTSLGRHRLTHVEYVNPSDYNRFNQLNVTADAQVAGNFSKPERWHENDEFVTPSLNNNIIPLKSLKLANARITLSSDWDVSSLNPFVGMQNAVTRYPQELTLEEVVKAYTINAAYVMRQEDKVGTLEVGKEADFIVINQNIFDISKSKISQTQVLRTYLQGRLIYKK
ncbi:MAG: amidohydrolase [Flavobacteriaceae bacterium]|nr:amidohydrolase [Flavobacteriaceae bacterium]